MVMRRTVSTSQKLMSIFGSDHVGVGVYDHIIPTGLHGNWILSFPDLEFPGFLVSLILSYSEYEVPGI